MDTVGDYDCRARRAGIREQLMSFSTKDVRMFYFFYIFLLPELILHSDPWHSAPSAAPILFY